MTLCLETQKSNCKNCYKCIRHCPVKSIGFSNGQAHIIHDECILCGECYAICPQNAKQIRNDLNYAKQLIQSENKVYVSLAPSFLVYYEGKSISDIEVALEKLGFQGVYETAIGATIVKKQYEEIIKGKSQNIIISSCCHTVNTLIQKHYTKALPYLAKVITPMQAHGILLKKEHRNCKVVFIGPCISKKAEADQSDSIDCALTFQELDQWFEEENIKIESNVEKECPNKEKERARMFPTTGGIFGCMDMDSEYNYFAVDGMDNCINVLKDIDQGNLGNCFIEMSACSGSCIAGPIMRKNSQNSIKSRLIIQKHVGTNDFDNKILEFEELRQEFTYEKHSKLMPGSLAITQILNKMGKNTPEKELNCGSCGYNSCKEKAVAVLMGKADLSMCLPFLKDKAESFSDNIIKNTPNGIIVLDEQLVIQQINNAAKEIINLPNYSDIIGNPVIRILNPVDYVMVLNESKNIYNNRKYLAEYKKYIEETIIYDKEYHIIMVIMKDITNEEKIKHMKVNQSKAAVEITDQVIEKQTRIVQEIASLLGETTAETKVALHKLKETLQNE